MPTVPSLDDYRLAHDRLLESLWLAAVDLDLPFAAQLAAPRRVDRYAAACDVCLSAPAHEHWCPLR